MYYMMDRKYGNMRMGFWTMCCALGAAAMMLSRYSTNIEYRIGVILLVVVTIIGELSEMKVNIAYRYMTASVDYYLNGYRVFDVLDGCLFNRLAFYVGHGLCYEVAVLNMILLSNDRTSRYVIARVTTSKDSRFWHSWVEIKRFGLWWCIDPTSDNDIISLRRIHNLQIDAEYRKIIPWDEFWCYRATHDLQERLSKRSTSYLFHELSLFRREAASDGAKLLIGERSYDYAVPNDGRAPSHTLPGGLDPATPINQRIINEYMANWYRLVPKRRSQRLALKAAKASQSAS